MTASHSEPKAAAQVASVSAKPKLFGNNRPPRHNVHAAMNFEQLIAKVEQAEEALETRERQVAADLRQMKATWRAMWTPGRIVMAGLIGGFAMGRLDPARVVAKGGGFMQLFSMLTSLVAGGNAQAAASKAEKAADSAADVADAVAPSAEPPSWHHPQAATPLDEAVRRAAAESARE